MTLFKDNYYSVHLAFFFLFFLVLLCQFVVLILEQTQCNSPFLILPSVLTGGFRFPAVSIVVLIHHITNHKTHQLVFPVFFVLNKICS